MWNNLNNQLSSVECSLVCFCKRSRCLLSTISNEILLRIAEFHVMEVGTVLSKPMPIFIKNSYLSLCICLYQTLLVCNTPHLSDTETNQVFWYGEHITSQHYQSRISSVGCYAEWWTNLRTASPSCLGCIVHFFQGQFYHYYCMALVKPIPETIFDRTRRFSPSVVQLDHLFFQRLFTVKLTSSQNSSQMKPEE